MRNGTIGRTLAMLAVAALVLSGIEPQPAAAGSSGASLKTGVAAASGDELSARRRHPRYRRSGNAAAIQTFGAIAGTIGGIVAAEQARRYYRRQYYPYYGQPYGYHPYRAYGGYGGYSYYDPYW